MYPFPISLVSATALSLGLTISVAAQEAVPANRKKPRPEAAPGFVVLKEASILPLTGFEQEVFVVAHSGYLAKAYTQSAAELRKASALLRLVEGSATREGRGVLRSAIQGLDTLTRKIDAGNLVPVREFARELGRAQLAFARGHYLKANSLWAKKMDVQWAGQHIKAAAIDLASAAKWVQDEFEPEAVTALDRAAGLGDRLVRKLRVAGEDVNKAMQGLAKHLDDLGATLTDNNPAVQPKLVVKKHFPGWVVVEAQTMFPLMPEIQRAFDHARDRYAAHEAARAGNAVRRAGALLRIARVIARPESRAGIDTAITDLEAMASDLDEGKVRSAASLGGVFARADLALATDNCLQAKACWSKKQLERAGGHLRSASQLVREATARLDAQLSEDTKKILTRIDKLGATLIGKDDLEVTADEQTFDEFTKAVSILSRKLAK